MCTILFTAGMLLLSACNAPGVGTAPVASAVPVTGNNSAPTAAQSQSGAIPEAITPAVKVIDQPIDNGVVTIDSVTSPGPGWIVIHINNSGAPGEIIGWSPVKSGVNSKVQVQVDASKATPVLYAMLHVDAGSVGVYEFPGPDKPLTVNGQMVNPPFGVTGGAGAQAANAGQSAATQPAAGQPTATKAAASNGLPKINLPGEVTTNVPGAAQAATTAAKSGGGAYGAAATATQPASGGAASGGAAAGGPASVSVATNAKLGKILVDSKGMTLYIFKKDTPGKSNCSGGCLENWPPLLVNSGTPTAGEGAAGKLGTIARTDNGTQITYNDLPLYYFAGDQVPGDVNGQGIGGSWFAATP